MNPRSAVVVPVVGASTRHATFSTNDTTLAVVDGAVDSYSDDSGVVFTTTAGAFVYVANKGDSVTDTVEVTATRSFFPVVTPGVSGVALNSTATDGPLLFLSGAANSPVCANVTTGATATGSNAFPATTHKGSLFFLKSTVAGSYLACKTAASSLDAYQGVNANSNTETLSVAAYSPPNGTYGTTYTFTSGAGVSAYNFGATPANKDYVIVVNSDGSGILYSDYYPALPISAAAYGYLNLPSGRPGSYSYLAYNPSSNSAVTFTRVEATPSCDANNACSARSTCTNGLCSSDCTGGYSGYGCSVAPDATTSPATTPAPNGGGNGGNGNKPNSGSALVASVAVVFAVVALVF
jgi:hypothetical protein